MSTEYYCKCPDWTSNIAKLEARDRLLYARNPDVYRGYEGALFKFCPWCGTRLAVKGAEPDRLSE